MATECPVCYESYSPDNPAKGPGGECVHSMCEACCIRTAEFMHPPFQCPECRCDITTWLVSEFPHIRPPVLTLEAAVAFANEFGIVLPSLDPLILHLEEYNRTLFAESEARMQAADDRYMARFAEIRADIDTFEARGRANLIAIQERFTARLDEIGRNLPSRPH